MRVALFALLALGATSALNVTPAAARPDRYFPFSLNTASGYPFCMRTRYDTDDCSYSNYAQCAASASGLGQTCFQNPAGSYYSRESDAEAPTARRRHRHPSHTY